MKRGKRGRGEEGGLKKEGETVREGKIEGSKWWGSQTTIAQYG